MTKFHSNLSSCIKRQDTDGANAIVMDELGKVVVHHRADFVDLLVNSDSPAHATLADTELIKMYFDNIRKKELLIGTALLVNMHNKVQSGFNGESEVNDSAVKAVYKVMSSSLAGPLTNEQIEAKRQDWRNLGVPETQWNNAGGVIAGAIGAVAGLGSKLAENQGKKKYGATDSLAAQQAAKSALTQSILAERKAQITAATKAKEAKAKNLRIGLIVGGSILGIALIGTVIYFIKK